MNKEELKPCPFCGGKVSDYGVMDRDDGFAYSIICHNKECFLRNRQRRSRDDIIRIWNTRPLEE